MFKDPQHLMTRRRPKPTNVFADTPTAIAARFGVSAKALRVYERLGLIRPKRTGSGWRVYGQAEIERLAAIVALKQMGLPLKRIGTLLGGSVDLASVLALQEAALEDSKAATDAALSLVRAARKRLQANAALSPDELANLVRRSKMTNFKWTPKMEELAQKHYTPEQLKELRARDFTQADQARVSDAWAQIYDDIAALGPDADPATAKALAIGRRAHALIMEFTQGDPALFKAAGAMKSDMMKDPEIARQGPATPAQFQMLGRIFGEMKKRGEIPAS